MSTEITIRPACEADLTEMFAVLETANMHRVPSPEMPELDLACYFVAEVDQRIVGLCGYKVLSPTAAKTTLMAVLPECRGLGVGLLLQTRRMEVLCSLGIRTLTTNADLPATIAWYQKHFGYRVIGGLPKEHAFGNPDIHEWTTLEADLEAWCRERRIR